jgi:hypothetical protein
LNAAMSAESVSRFMRRDLGFGPSQAL